MSGDEMLARQVWRKGFDPERPELSIRVWNRLTALQALTVDKIADLDWREFRQVSGIGVTSLIEMLQFVSRVVIVQREEIGRLRAELAKLECDR